MAEREAGSRVAAVVLAVAVRHRRLRPPRGDRPDPVLRARLRPGDRRQPVPDPLERRDGLVVPELASAYTDRSWRRPGMIVEGDVVTGAFAAIGWTWGATFSAPVDTMHFSATGD